MSNRIDAALPATWHPPQPGSIPLPQGDDYSAGDVAAALVNETDRERRSMSWFLHSAAARLGGFGRVGALIPKLVPHVLGTATMSSLSPAARRAWSDATAKKVYDELHGSDLAMVNLLDSEPLRGFDTKAHWPKSYAAALDECADGVASIGQWLREYCLCAEPYRRIAISGSALPLVEIFAEFRHAWQRRALAQVAETSVTREVFGALDYACTAEPGITLIQGDPRTGKTASTRAWCDANAHRARYLALESSMTDSAFFADVNRALGNTALMNYGLSRLRQDIRDVLDTRDLLLVIDEGQQLWGHAKKSVPNKINWLMTAVVNRGCAVALVVTPQFMGELSRFEKDTAWAAAQWKGRIVNYRKLPSTLPADEIKAVSRHIFPEGDTEAIRALAAFAVASPSYLQAISMAARRARFLAEQGRELVGTNHIKRAISEQLGLVEDLAKDTAPQTATSRGRGRVSALPPPIPAVESLSKLTAANRLQDHCSGVPEPVADRSRPVLVST